MNYEEESEPEPEYTTAQTAAEYLEELRKLFGDFGAPRAKEIKIDNINLDRKPAKIEYAVTYNLKTNHGREK
jgi:hypothetical protein